MVIYIMLHKYIYIYIVYIGAHFTRSIHAAKYERVYRRSRRFFFYVSFWFKFFYTRARFLYRPANDIHESARKLVNVPSFFLIFYSYLKKHIFNIYVRHVSVCVYGPTKTKGGPGRAYMYVGRQINHATRTDKLFGGRPAAILASCARCAHI